MTTQSVSGRHAGLSGLAAAILIAGCSAPAAQETPGLSAAPTVVAATPSATPTPSPTLSPTRATESATGWTHIDDLGDGMGWDLATSVARGRDAFVAIGVRYVRAPEVIFARPREYLWVSDDGQTWDEVAMGPEFVGASSSTSSQRRTADSLYSAWAI